VPKSLFVLPVAACEFYTDNATLTRALLSIGDLKETGGVNQNTECAIDWRIE
jgi:hypothetical protein